MTHLTKEQRHQLLDPPTTALIAFHLGHGTSEHYHTLAAAMMLAHEIVATTQRHQHLAPLTLAACGAMNAIFNRGNWQATDDEKTAIDNGLTVYKAVIEATTAKKVKKCLNNVYRSV